MQKLKVHRAHSPLRLTDQKTNNDKDGDMRRCFNIPSPLQSPQLSHGNIADDIDDKIGSRSRRIVDDDVSVTDIFADRHHRRQEPTLSGDITLVCENLIAAGKFERLERLMWAMPVDTNRYKSLEILLVAKCYLAFRKGKFDELYELLQSRHFSKRYHRQLQYLWRTARYIEAEKARGRVLGSVGKYRIRRKFPLPYTIWDGECMSYCFREEARDILNAAYKVTPYPSAQEKYAIAQQAKLSVTQVSNWFKNKRQRARAKKADGKRTTTGKENVDKKQEQR